MELPSISKNAESRVCLSAEELLNFLTDSLKAKDVKGLHVKIAGKDEKDSYVIELLVDKKRILAAKCVSESRKEIMYGDEAIRTLARIAEIPVIVTVQPLDETSFRLALANNIEIYSKTPAIPLSEVFKRQAEETIEEAIEEAKVEREREIREIEEETTKVIEEKKEEAEIPEEFKIEIMGNVENKETIENALREYVNLTKSEIAKYLNGAHLKSGRISAEIGTGTIGIVAEFNVVSERGDPEIIKRKSLFLINKHLPKIMRKINLKPIIKDIKVNAIVGSKISSMEEKEREDTSLWRLTKPPTHQLAQNLYLTVDPKFKPYFTGFARTLLREIQDSKIKVDKLEIEIYGGVKEFEINVKLQGTANDLDEPRVQAIITRLAKRHASELSKILNKYVWVNSVTVKLGKSELGLSAKASEILKRKKEIEEEVERMLKEAKIEELNYLLEDKKKEIDRIIKPRIDSAIKELKEKLKEELKALPNAEFRWLKANYEFRDNIVELSIEASLAKREEEGLFGVLSTVSDEDIRKSAIDVILREIKNAERENNIQIRLKRLDIAVR
ncbi:hypothetical protein [Pyrococcus abyssi]|uniref:Uncharacterized protein n=1 Tax=Pyrococcus abyssi (strain GE5 / Orsay) TaxID=272844 RepID=Q9V222_PYRAB|nr:hypothetical protein [Pyrococcus abyssi]CAB49176.1 Hypothetical protein PAB2186 [Pyrococcus abyssi GE5]CCE69629.1 TPA: hypothetical protein PAB2186 [Pyrococcus abyssi GE5]